MIFTASILVMFSLSSMFMSLFLISETTIMFFNFNILNLSTWMINMNMMIDWMSSLFMSTVMFITSMILIFSNKYIPKTDKPRFLMILLIFVTSMIMLIISDNIIFMLLGWDGLGLTSYILVMTYQDPKSTKSGTITMISNRIGDILILLAISTMFMSGDFFYWMNNYFTLISMTLIIMAAFTKSAQIPFAAWLPEAMAAPTPISALVHSSTLVTAGVYILLRMFNSNNSMLISIISTTAILTTFMSGLSANWEKDLKKIIALSTLSQIAMMMYVISLKKINVAFFHLITHALFKSTLFLCAGFMIHSLAYQDSRSMNLSTLNSPLLASALGTTNMALMGLPFMSGFYSKDMILESMLSSNFNMIMSLMMMTAVGLTASYSMRMMSLTINYNLKLPEYNFTNNNDMTLAILLMIFFSIYSGSAMSWLLSPPLPLLVPNFMKIAIPMTILMGIMIGSLSQFKSQKYFKTGYMALKLWFLANLSSTPFMSISKLSTLMKNHDMSWHELMAATSIFNTNMLLSKLPSILTSSLMFIILLMLLMPIITY